MLIGRNVEIAQLRSLLEQVRGGMSGTVVLRGEAGIGKTTLLNATAEAADDLRVMRLEGIESEMQLAYAGLHRLLVPYLSRLAELPEPQRAALGSAFGLASAAPADRFMVGLSVLTLLGEAAKDEPLLIIVDDTQWLDHESVATLVFVARRLLADRIALIFAARESPEVGETFQGIPDLWVAGLGEVAARRLLSSSVADPVNHQVAGRVVAITRGNPLALVELSAELSSEHLMDRSQLPDPLPIGELIEARFLRQVRLLPPETQTMLLAAAADPEGDPATLGRVAEVLGLSKVAIESAVYEGLLVLDPRVEFRHPLVRSAVYSGASTADRRRVHQALADVIDAERDPGRRALHLASASLGPDEGVAAALEQSATRARARGGYIAESSFLVRAAELTPDPHHEAIRRLAAAQAAFLAGNAGYADSLLDQARPHLADRIEMAQAQRLDGRLRTALGQSHVAPALLLEAAKAFEPLDRVLSHHSLIDAFHSVLASGQFAEGTTAAEIAVVALNSLDAQSTPATAADVLLRGIAMRFSGTYADAVPAMREAVTIKAAMSPEEINRWTYLGSTMASELWDEEGSLDTMERLEQAARARGSLSALQVAVTGWASIEIRAGRFEAARERYSELQDVTMAIGGLIEFYSLWDVELLCWQGDVGARSRSAAMVDVSSALRSSSALAYGHLSLSVLELAEGRYDDALVAAQSAAAAIGWGGRALPNLVEAAVRCGARQSAAEALVVLAERATASGTPWGLGLLARCRAMMGGNATAADLYEESLEHLGRTSLRTEVARTHLVYGEWLRRQKRRTEARDQLRQAYEMFDSMGARPFAERARVELLATGERARARRVETTHDLTSREMQVARLAAQRATSREIAGQLFISANTVDYHLRKVFQKLGVTSRRDLTGVLLENESR
jgi:DNA-binding CsgD family transcriptional regulator